MARPASVKSRFFMRPMAQADNLIMAAAGEGDISQGFHNLIAMFQVLWNAGYRPTMDLAEWLTHLRENRTNPTQTILVTTRAITANDRRHSSKRTIGKWL